MMNCCVPIFPESEVFLEARALLAIGLNGRIVVLQVNEENEFLRYDAYKDYLELSEVLIITSDTDCRESGLYEFKGFSVLEKVAPDQSRVIHRGACTKVAC